MRSSACRDRSCCSKVDPLLSCDGCWVVVTDVSSSRPDDGAGVCLFGLATTVFSPKPLPDADSDDHDDWHLTSGVLRGDGVKAATGEITSAAAIADVREIVDFIVYYCSSSRLHM